MTGKFNLVILCKPTERRGFGVFFMKQMQVLGTELKDYPVREAMRVLDGFLCDKFDSDKDEACENVRSAIEKSLVSQYKNDISGFSNIQLENMEVSFDSQDLKYILVPVWLMNFKYEGEIHSFAVNGQTGSFTGKAPVGKSEYLKYFLLVFVIIAIIGVIIAFLT